jgi:hypothetical protein
VFLWLKLVLSALLFAPSLTHSHYSFFKSFAMCCALCGRPNAAPDSLRSTSAPYVVMTPAPRVAPAIAGPVDSAQRTVGPRAIVSERAASFANVGTEVEVRHGPPGSVRHRPKPGASTVADANAVMEGDSHPTNWKQRLRTTTCLPLVGFALLLILLALWWLLRAAAAVVGVLVPLMLVLLMLVRMLVLVRDRASGTSAAGGAGTSADRGSGVYAGEGADVGGGRGSCSGKSAGGGGGVGVAGPGGPAQGPLVAANSTVWLRENDTGGFDQYNDADCRTLEAAKAAGRGAVALSGPPGSGHVYEVDVVGMTQTNRVTRKTRKVERHFASGWQVCVCGWCSG